MRRFEYRTEFNRHGKTLEEIIDRDAVMSMYGKDGWELVAVVEAGDRHARFYFKREIPEAPQP